MNEQALKALELLAAKLGVGAQALWAALIRQAPISSAMDVLVALLTAAFGYWYFRRYLPWSQSVNADLELPAIAGVFLGGITLLVLAIGTLFSADIILAGFINPDYWALKQLASMVKSK